MAKDAIKERAATCLFTAILIVAFFAVLLWATPLAWGWDCPIKAKDDWNRAVYTCSGCLRQVPHVHSISVPTLVAIPGMKTITTYNAPLCCICFRKVLIGTAKLTDVLDWAAAGEAAVRKELAKKAAGRSSVGKTKKAAGSMPPARATKAKGAGRSAALLSGEH